MADHLIPRFHQEVLIQQHQLAAGQPITDYRGKLIVPGFVDSHIHYPQTEMIGAFGEQLYAVRPYSAQVPRAVQALVGYLRDAFKDGFPTK